MPDRGPLTGKRRSGEGKPSVGGTLERIRADPVSIWRTSKPKQPVHVGPPRGRSGQSILIDPSVVCLSGKEGGGGVMVFWGGLKMLSRLLGF